MPNYKALYNELHKNVTVAIRILQRTGEDEAMLNRIAPTTATKYTEAEKLWQHRLTLIQWQVDDLKERLRILEEEKQK